MARASYRRVLPTFWTDPEVRRLPQEQKHVLLYFFTSPHSNMIGLYWMPLDYAALETGIAREKIEEWVDGPLARWVTYDSETEEILVHGAAKHQVGDELKEKDNRLKKVANLLEETHSDRLVNQFLELYSDWPLNVEPRNVDNLGKNTPSKDLASPSEAPSEPLRSHSSSSSITEAESETEAENPSDLPVGSKTQVTRTRDDRAEEREEPEEREDSSSKSEKQPSGNGRTRRRRTSRRDLEHDDRLPKIRKFFDRVYGRQPSGFDDTLAEVGVDDVNAVVTDLQSDRDFWEKNSDARKRIVNSRLSELFERQERGP